MAALSGKCVNFGLCSQADSREAVTPAEEEGFLCPECGKPLERLGAKKPPNRKRGMLLLAAVLVAAVVLGVYVFNVCCASPPVVPPVAEKSAEAEILLRLHGSNTIGAKLAPALAEAFLRQMGAREVSTKPGEKANELIVEGAMNGQPAKQIQIQAHGSRTAFEDLASNVCDIGMSSRKITAEETSRLSTLGDLTSNESEKVVGLDALTVVVHPSNPVESFTTQQVAGIFTGKVSGWNLYARDERSGTAALFRAMFLDGADVDANAKRLEDHQSVAQHVAADLNGIGYMGLAFADGLKRVPVAQEGMTPQMPDRTALATESYPFGRRLYFYLPAGAKQEAKAFVEFALGDAGQQVVESAGVVGQKITALPPTTLPENAPAEYAGLAITADRLSLDIRFRLNSRELDSKAYDDLERVVNTLSEPANKSRSILLFGFADSSGQRAANLALSKDRAAAVAEQLRQRGIDPALLTGFGQDLPVAPNDTEEGRQRNRRVEVWLRR